MAKCLRNSLYVAALMVLISSCTVGAQSTPLTGEQFTASTPSGYPASVFTSVPPRGYPGELPASSVTGVIPTPFVLTEPPALTGQVAFHSGSEGANNIYVLDLANGKKQQLTSGGDNIEPVWSPDGAQIAYACKPAQGQFFALCLMSADGTNQRQIVGGSFNNWGPSWSPDGQQLTFVSSQDPYAHVHMLDISSSSTRRLMNAPGNEGGPRWSADGSRIIFMADRAGGTNGSFNIYMIRPDGSEEQQLTSFGQDDRPAWSPDGRFVTFRREVVSASTYSGNEIMLMDTNSRNVQQLTSNTLSDDWPSFSPDGQWVVYSTLRNTTPFLQIVSIQGGASAPLVKGELVGNAPDWKP